MSTPLGHDRGIRRAIATVCLSGMLEDKLDAVAGAGFDGVEIFENDLIASSSTPAEVRKRCADLGLSIDLYQPFRDFDTVLPDRLAANLRRAEHKFTVMEDLGTDTMLVCSSVAGDALDDPARIADQFHELAERASRRGMRIAYEALAWGRHVNTWNQSWDIVRLGDHPALGLCLDSFHVLSRTPEPEAISAISEIPGDRIFFLQLADAPLMSMDVLQWSRHHRLFPGQGEFDLPQVFVDHVRTAGYAGPLSLEGLRRRLPPIGARTHRRRRIALPSRPRGVCRAWIAAESRGLRTHLPTAGADTVRPRLCRAHRRRWGGFGGGQRTDQLRLHQDGFTPVKQDPAVAAR